MDLDGRPRRRAPSHDPDTNVVVVGERGAHRSAFGIMSYPNDDAHLLLFAVRGEHQRRGVGSAILRWLEEAARTAGAKRIRVECRRDNDGGAQLLLRTRLRGACDHREVLSRAQGRHSPREVVRPRRCQPLNETRNPTNRGAWGWR